KIARIGSTKEFAIDVRVVCATHRDLPAQIAASKFRQDLYYRISAFSLRVPPLRERKGEIALLAELFARRFAEPLGKASPTISADARDALTEHRWAGNIRELRNAIEHAVLLADGGVIDLRHLPETIAPAARPIRSATPPAPAPLPDGMRGELAEIE